MTFIDLHNHIDVYKDSEIKKIISRAREKEVKIILTNSVDKKSGERILELSKEFQEIKPCLGIYPVEATKMSEKEFQENLEFIEKNKGSIYAVGEVGLDLKEIPTIKKQSQRFEKLIQLSKQINKPLIVHCRKAEQQTIEVLENQDAKKVIIHCFMGNMKLVERIISNKWSLTIPTCVKHSQHFQEIIKKAPIKQLFCETDSPFLHPDKERNNEPVNVLESYKKISEIKNIPLKEVEDNIEENFKRLF